MEENMDYDDGIIDPYEENQQNSNEQEFECDFSAYNLFHEGNTGAPCLSFDILKDDLGQNRTCDTGVTCYFVTGTQANRTQLNKMILLKMKNLKKVSSENDEDESDEEEKEDPSKSISSVSVRHNGCVNRIRANWVSNVPLAATWSELGAVQIWDLSPMYDYVNEDKENSNDTIEVNPIFSFRGHYGEGFALDWSPSMPGTLASGDCNKNIHIWKPEEGGKWNVSSAFSSHNASVEDIQWSPNEANVFASCSVDKSIKIWDARINPKKACMLTCNDAHEQDINVIHWNRNEPFIVSGGDDGQVLVWDLKKFQSKVPIAQLKYHSKPITTVEWHPSDSSVLATGGEDDQILQWDLAVEKDSSQEADENVPDQLLFIHKGQKEIKELHWHSQIPGLIISTAHSGFNIFKTISC